ncbi:uncharacterized protein LOC120180711 [Hibiscus syriacus]|uniref:uncharacterized protein LOC120180711 n=1 Tax=Hibiscus syriacus TaxID=106335 RepID=UPI001923B647|nr:uncharacterized protein LOC120180711 [Hibiscus syriacus]
MDPWAVHLKNANPVNPFSSASLLSKRNSTPERLNSFKISKFGVFQIRVSRICLPSSAHRSFTVKSMAKNSNHDNSSSSSSSSGNGDQPIPDRDSSRINKSSDSNKSEDDASQKSHDVNTNWREFRAMLYNNYQVAKKRQIPMVKVRHLMCRNLFA